MLTTLDKPASSSKDAALELLHRGVSDLMTSEGWREALTFRRRFHAYSFFNTCLILAQKPDATLVAGYRTWQKSNRFVCKGEKAIRILAPMLRRDPDDPDEKVLVGFKSVPVFDVSQTDGEPLPKREPPKQLEDTPKDLGKVKDFAERLTRFCETQGATVRFGFEHPSALGVWRPTQREIAIRGDLSATQSLKTLVHEAAHMLLHTGADERRSAELEAESAAYLVCHAVGIDSSSYSFHYLATWTDSLEALVQAGERASQAANTILNALQEDPSVPDATGGIGV